jgi:hypothetical protein
MISRMIFRREILVLGLLVPFALGCPAEQAPPREVAADLGRWMAAIQQWDAEEKEVFTAIGKINQSQYVEDEYVARTLKETLPIVRTHNRKVAEFKAETKELEPVVRQFRKGWEDLELAFHAVIVAAQAKDYARLAKARSQMEYARGEILGSFAALDELLELNDMQVRMLRRKEELDGKKLEEDPGAAEESETEGTKGTSSAEPPS